MIKTAIIGASGFIGRHLWASYRREFPDCVGTSFSHPRPGLTPFDLRTPNLAALHLEDTGHKCVLITSAKPNINYCEENRDAANAVNVTGMLKLIEQIGRSSMSVIFLSSDYVFGGTTGQYADDADTNPTTEYGRQKVAVERAIPSLTDRYLILRLSKIYGLEKGDGTLLDDMAHTLAEGRPMMAAADQFFCPTEVGDLVRVIQTAQENESRRVLNICSPETWSRYEIACALADAMHLDCARITRCNLDDIPAMRNRPHNTSMRCSTLPAFPPLKEHIELVAGNWNRLV
jgi:dTDP-4-dehydrorhamnose reductase